MPPEPTPERDHQQEREAWSADALSRRAVEYMLHRARERLGMEAAFLAELTETHQLYRATTGQTGTFTIYEGGSLPRIESYCRQVMESGRPWIIPDVRNDPAVAHLAITAAGDFGAYIAVPVHLPDGSPFGTLCCLSHSPRPDLADRDVVALEAMADVLGFHVAQLRHHAARIASLESDHRDLAGTLRQHELRLGLLAELMDASRTPSFVLDPATLRIDFVNRAGAAFLTIAHDEARGALLPDCLAGSVAADLRERLGPLLDGGADLIRYEHHEPGDDHVLEVVAQRVTTGGGDDAIMWTAHDVTERREAEDRLEHALRLEQEATQQLRRVDAIRQAFLTAVSHELRTPLTSLRLVAETLWLGRAPADAAQPLLDRLMVNADRLSRLLEDLLDLNASAHGEIRIDRQEVRLDDLVRDAVAQVEAGRHQVEMDLEPIECAVAPTKYQRIVVNLVVNAVVHTPPCRIFVHLRREPQQAHLVVEDDGPGISSEERDAVFEPFVQGDTAPSHQPGTGIGLSLVSTFAELHGGRAWVEPGGDGGAAFHVTIPIGEPGP